VAERRDGVQVLSRAAQMLRRLATEPEGLTSIELADGVVLPRSTAYRFPSYCTACGKALLAELPHAEAERLVPTRLEPFTAHTNAHRGELLRELDLLRPTGVAYDQREHSRGISAVDAAIRDASGGSAAVTVVMPAARLEGNGEHVASALLRVRDDIERALTGG
jgi:DNA-binding IclR family transcriptional regulator